MVGQAEFDVLMAAGDERTHARLRSLCMPHAGGWVSAPPIWGFGYRLTSPEFTSLMRYRLGLPLALRITRCTWCTGPSATLDLFGDHAASCQGKVGRTARHHRVRDALFKLAGQAGFSVEREPSHLIPTHPELRPADVLIHDWHADQSLCVDVAVANPLAASAISAASRKTGAAAASLEAVKGHKYTALCTANNLAFAPFVLETFGGMGPQARPILRRIAKALSTRSDLTEDQAINRVGNALSFACQRALARTLLARHSPLLLLRDDNDTPPHHHGASDGNGSGAGVG